MAASSRNKFCRFSLIWFRKAPTATTHSTTLDSYRISPKAVQELDQQITDLANIVANFADSFTTKELTFTRATGDTVTAKRVNAQELCVSDDSGAKTCITKTIFDRLLAGANAANSGEVTSGAPDTTPPTITITGDNPAHIHVGDSYADLGASVTDNVDQNLGLKYFLNGKLVSDIVIDTSVAATDTIDYVATDQAGNTATSTRTVIISPAVQADTATTTTQ